MRELSREARALARRAVVRFEAAQASEHWTGELNLRTMGRAKGKAELVRWLDAKIPALPVVLRRGVYYITHAEVLALLRAAAGEEREG